MLTEKEKHGMAEMLHRMQQTDLTSLAQTVTSRLILPESQSEAISAIILHTERASDLLKRRKIKKEFLFKYLHDKRVEGIDPGAEKAVIVNHVLALWGNQQLAGFGMQFSEGSGGHYDEDSCSLPEAPAPSRNTSYSSLTSLDLYTNPSSGGQSSHPPNLGMILNRTYSDPTAPSSSNGELMTRTESNVSLMQEDNSNSGPPISFAMNNDECGQGDVSTQQQTSPAISPNITASQAQDLASTFVKWFYDMMNNAFASPESSTEGEFRRDHFFPDASAKICLQPATCDANVQPEQICVQNSGAEVHSVMGELHRKYRLTYNPNLCRDGVRGTMDAHGLMMVSACGTLHNSSVVCGTFHQQFGLVRDPYEGNNWKIKFTYANLVSKAAVSEAPRLENFSQEQGASNGTTAMALS